MAATLINGSRIIAGTLNYGSSGGSSNAYTLTLSPAITSLVTGFQILVKANHTNTGAATINVNTLGAKNIKKHNDQDLASGDIESGQVFCCVYDGTNFQLMSLLGNAPGGGGSGSLTSNAGDSAFMPWGLCRFSADLNNIIASGDTQLYALESEVSKQYREFGFIVTAASGSGKGMVISIYTRASNGDLTKIAQSAGVLVDSIGKKYPAWSSGSAVSGGVLTLPAGQNLYLGMTLDSAAGAAPTIRYYDEAGAEVLGLITKDFTSTQKRAAVAASTSSGTGTSVTAPATIANASYSVVNEYRPLIAFLP